MCRSENWLDVFARAEPTHSASLVFESEVVDAVFLLRLDHAARLGIDVEQVVGEAEAGVERELADGHATGGVQVDEAHVLNGPAGGGQQPVDLFARTLLWVHYSCPPASFSFPRG